MKNKCHLIARLYDVDYYIRESATIKIISLQKYTEAYEGMLIAVLYKDIGPGSTIAPPYHPKSIKQQ